MMCGRGEGGSIRAFWGFAAFVSVLVALGGCGKYPTVVANDRGTAGTAGVVTAGSAGADTAGTAGRATAGSAGEAAGGSTSAGAAGDSGPLPIDTGVACDAIEDDGDPRTVEICGEAGTVLSVTVPELDATVTSSTYTANEWLFSGPSAIQQEVAADAVVEERACAVHGFVYAADGSALPNVLVEVLGHPELGYTLTQGSGRFDMMVNGGGPTTLVYRLDGLLEAQRTLDLVWGTDRWAADVVLLAADVAVTSLDLTSSEPFQVAQSSVMSDADGDRQATLFVPAGTEATMVFSDGSTEPLTTMDVRLTEFTVGESGLSAMPAELPPSTAYTYALELNADEAVAMSAQSVQFNQTVYLYVDNFLGFPVGMPVPHGAYARDRGVWVPEGSGVVLEILGIESDMAQLDVTGDGTADATDVLDALGITDEERLQLARSFGVGDQLWRTPLTHFTSPVDLNLPSLPPSEPALPPPPPTVASPDPDDCAVPGNSTIECAGQTLTETLPLAGTPFTLGYRSDRAAGGANSSIVIPLVGPEVPEGIASVYLGIQAAGQVFQYELEPEPDLRHVFRFDGRDAYGRVLQGSVPVTILVAYLYADSVYWSVDQFGAVIPSGEATAVPSRLPTLIQWQHTVTLEAWDESAAPETSVGGWELNVHHRYDPATGTLYGGNGAQRSARALGYGVNLVAGGGTSHEDGALGPDAEIGCCYNSSMAVGPDGTIYFKDDGADGSSDRIRKVTPDGRVWLVAGTGAAEHSGDGGPAVDAGFDIISDLDVGPDGSLYVLDNWAYRVRKITPDGIITTVAGNGGDEALVDGIPATESGLLNPDKIAVGPDSTLYIASIGAIRRVDPGGIIHTFMGSSTVSGQSPEIAREPSALDIAAGNDGSLYLLQGNVAERTIWRIAPDGTEAQVVGAGNSPWMASLAVGANGNVYVFNDWDFSMSRTRLSDATSVVIVGPQPDENATHGFEEGGYAAGMGLGTGNFAIGPDETPYMRREGSIVAIRTPRGFGADELMVPTEDGQQVFLFDRSGRHLETRNGRTGETLLSFGYTSNGALATITDGDGNTTTILRAADGSPERIVGPFGHATGIGLDSEGRLSALGLPGSITYEATYHPNGLLATFSDAVGKTATFTYDDFGRLVADEDDTGGFHHLTRTELATGWEVARTTAEGRTTVYRVETLDDGATLKTNTFPDGSQASVLVGPGAQTTASLADGTQIVTTRTADSLWGVYAPQLSTTVTLPSGLTRTSSTTRAAVEDPDDVTRLNEEIVTQAVNGRTTTRHYERATLSETTTSPAGRQAAQTIDGMGRPLTIAFPGSDLISSEFTYDELGRMSRMVQGERETLLSYYDTSDEQNGYLQSITDPSQQATVVVPDALGRPRFSRRDDVTTAFSWDGASNMTSVSPPGRPAHTQSYTSTSLLSEYAPPAAGLARAETTYTYNLDRQLVTTTRPDGGVMRRTYDDAGRLRTVTLPDTTEATAGSLDYTYHEPGCDPTTGCAPGRVQSIQGPSDVTLEYGYDGQLTTRVAWLGDASGAVLYTYDEDFQVAAESVDDGTAMHTTLFGRNPDGQLVCASQTSCDPPDADALTLSYAAELPQLVSTTLGAITTTHTYNTYGELASIAARAASSALYEVIYDSAAAPRDPLGRVTTKTETLRGVTEQSEYAYDAQGRLTDVWRDGTLIEHYDYDPNGNRLSLATPTGTVDATYDDQDRLLSAGRVDFAYSDAGELRERVDSSTGEATGYHYDALGNLRRVELPSGTRIEYSVDAHRRRVAKSVNGTIVKRWLYRDALNPVAELDGAGTLTWRYVYASKPHVPDYAIEIATGNRYRFITDQLGSPVLVVNAENPTDILLEARYSAFGEQTVVSGDASALPFGFAGGVYDGDTGLVRFGARDYDSRVGRWTSKDPILWSGGQGNLYGYVGNNPVNLIDPFGLRRWSNQEVEEILEDYRYQIDSSNILERYLIMWDRHRDRGPSDYWTNNQNDTFCVRGQELDSADFGNFLAGYATGYALDPTANLLVRIAGGGYGIAGVLGRYGEPSLDQIFWLGDNTRSVFFITAGTANGIYDRLSN